MRAAGLRAAALAVRYEAGDAWLADCSGHPERVRAAWDADDLAPIATGQRWLAAEARLSTVMTALYRIGDVQRGPVLAAPSLDKAWLLVPLSAADDLADVRQVRVRPAGWTLDCPPTGRAIARHFWLWRPDGSGYLTDPALLAAALGPGGYRPPAEASA